MTPESVVRDFAARSINGKQIAIPVMGAFEIAPDGKIRAWRDYFDMQQFTNQLG